MAEVGSVVIGLNVNSIGAISGFNKADAAITGFATKANRQIANLDHQVGVRAGNIVTNINKVGLAAKAGLGGLATGAVAALAPLASVTMAVQKAKQAMTEFTKISDVAARLGVNVERLQELRFAAEQGGMAVDNFDVAFRRFIRRSAEAARGTGAAVKAFRELNIGLRDGDGRLKESHRLLGEVADALVKVQSPADKLRLAFAMFDTDGAAMVNVLAKGSAGLDDFARKAREMGLVVDSHLIQRAAQMSQEFDTASRVIDMKLKAAFINIAPAMIFAADVAGRMADDIRRIVDAFTEMEMKSGQALDERLAGLGLERLEVENKILAIKQEQRELTSTARDLGFGEDSAVAQRDLAELEAQLKRIAEAESRITHILESRRKVTELPTITVEPDADAALRFIEEYRAELGLSADARRLAAETQRILNLATAAGIELEREMAEELAKATIARDDAEAAARRGVKAIKEQADEYARLVGRTRENIATMEAERAAVEGLTPGTVEYTFAVERARLEQQLWNAALAAGRAKTPELEAEIRSLADTYASVAIAARESRSATSAANSVVAETGNLLADIGRIAAGIFEQPVESLWDFVDEVMKPLAMPDRQRVNAYVSAIF